MTDITFACTMCGRCCYKHNLPLTVEEAISWLEEDGKVHVYCEADIWSGEPPTEDLRAAHRKRRSFAASSGSSRVRVTALLVAIASGGCKNLGADSLCRIYERRPLVCRIYPAEVSPFIQLDINRKACPPEAWAGGATLMSHGRIVDTDMQRLVEKSRQIDQEDAPKKARLCRYLSIDVAALAGEGFVSYDFDRKTLLDALRSVQRAELESVPQDRGWRLYSPSLSGCESLRAKGVDVAAKRPADPYSFISFSSVQPSAELSTRL